jgi:hypothetical protein
MLRDILRELKEHAPFTLVGGLTGIALMAALVLAKAKPPSLEPFFESFHALHVLLSAIVTAAMYRRYRRSLLAGLVIGYTGSVGIGTLSDIIFPYLGGSLVGAHMHFHLAFIEHWWLINPVALLGVVVGLARPTTKIPHSGHVLLSTWASLFYLSAHGEANWLPLLPLVLVVLFVAVWVPCCASDIVYPLLFVGGAGGEGHEGHAHG